MSIFQYCSDNEDLFPGHDSILGDSSFMAKLDNAEQYVTQHEDIYARQTSKGPFPNHTHLKAATNANTESLTDSLLVDCLKDESFQDLPSSQAEFQEEVHENAKNCKPSDGGHTSTPLVKKLRADCTPNGLNKEEDTRPVPKARRSMANAMKRAMLENAATSFSSVAKIAQQQQKEILVTEEINVAMQTMQSISTETDLGPFFGLPSKVKDLIGRLKGIQDLYGKGNIL